MRATVTTTTAALLTSARATGPGHRDDESQSYVVFSPTSTGVVLLEPAPAGTAAGSVDMSQAARWDFSKAMLTYTLEPGQALYAKTASGSVDLDMLKGGER